MNQQTDLLSRLYKLMDESPSFLLFAPHLKNFFKFSLKNASEKQLQNAINLIKKNSQLETKLAPYFHGMQSLQAQADQLTRKAGVTIMALKSHEDKEKSQNESAGLIESLKNIIND